MLGCCIDQLRAPVISVLKHDLAEQFDAYAERCSGLLAKVTSAANPFHYGDDVIVVSSLELKGRSVRGGALCIGEMLERYPISVLFHKDLLC